MNKISEVDDSDYGHKESLTRTSKWNKKTYPIQKDKETYETLENNF